MPSQRGKSTPTGSKARARGARKEPERDRSAAARSRLLELIARGAPLKELLTGAVAFVEDLAPGWLAAVHLVDRERSRLGSGTTTTLPRAVGRGMETLTLDDSWPVGRVAKGRPPHALDEGDGNDGGHGSDDEPFRRLLSTHGLGRCVPVPALSPKGELVAMLTAFEPHPGRSRAKSSTKPNPGGKRGKRKSPTPLAVLETGASLLGLGVSRIRTLERLALAQTAIDRSREPALCAREDGTLLYWNRSFATTLGYSDAELHGIKAYALVAGGDERSYRRVLRILTRRNRLRLGVEALRKEDRSLAASATIGLVEIGDSSYLCALVRDVSEEKERAQRLRDCEERYALQARGAKDGLWDWNLESGEITLSARYSALLGLGSAERKIDPHEWRRRIHPDDVARVEHELRSATMGQSAVFECEYRMRHAAGSSLWVLARGEVFRARNGRPTRIAGSLTDITSQKLAEEQLRHDALHDVLTGLPNRAMLMDRLRRLLERARHARGEFRFAVLFLDFDRFKRVNDSLGHQAGDQLLAAIGKRLSACLRPGDTVARLGGDEFAIVLERLGDVTEATRVAERVHQFLREPFQLHGIELSITTSIGIAIGDRSYTEPGDVLRDADTAMYRAKAAGKARHEIFDAAMHARAVEQLRLEAELRQAVEREEFQLLYQPVLSLSDRRLVGFEALTRWRHPTRGLLSPAAFLQTAEETGVIVELGWWVLGRACRDMTAWLAWMSRDRGVDDRLSIHVNLSDRQLFHPELTARIEQTLSDVGLQPRRLALDISESVIMQKAESSVAILSQLKSLGVRIHLDDFGTGYSSLGYLHRFEIDALKIDRSFVRHLRAGGENWTAVRTIVGLAHNLGMSVIAEGVETEEQLDELVGFGCREGQGSLFYPPLAPEEVQDLLNRGAELIFGRRGVERAR